MNKQEIIVEVNLDTETATLPTPENVLEVFLSRLTKAKEEAFFHACDSHSLVIEGQLRYETGRIVGSETDNGELYVLDGTITIMQVEYDAEKPFWAKVTKYING